MSQASVSTPLYIYIYITCTQIYTYICLYVYAYKCTHIISRTLTHSRSHSHIHRALRSITSTSNPLSLAQHTGNPYQPRTFKEFTHNPPGRCHRGNCRASFCPYTDRNPASIPQRRVSPFSMRTTKAGLCVGHGRGGC